MNINLADTAYICRYGYLIVRNTDGSPNTAYLFRAFTKDFENPHFGFIGNGKAFARVAITILLDEIAN